MTVLIASLLFFLGFALPAHAQVTDWEKEWNRILAAAKKEGKLTIAANPDPDVRRMIPEKFTARYGIPVEYIGGSSGQIRTRLQAERTAGLFTIDALLGGVDPVVGDDHRPADVGRPPDRGLREGLTAELLLDPVPDEPTDVERPRTVGRRTTGRTGRGRGVLEPRRRRRVVAQEVPRREPTHREHEHQDDDPADDEAAPPTRRGHYWSVTRNAPRIDGWMRQK